MDKNNGADSGNEPLLSRAHVMQVLHRAGLNQEQIATVTDGIEFPAPLSKITPKALKHGISRTSLTDQMGGSP